MARRRLRRCSIVQLPRASVPCPGPDLFIICTKYSTINGNSRHRGLAGAQSRYSTRKRRGVEYPAGRPAYSALTPPVAVRILVLSAQSDVRKSDMRNTTYECPRV